MMIIRRSEERGHADHGWLKTWHTFSFAGYYDPQHMGFGALRVINEDVIAGGKGFGMHPHRDMEIVTYMLAGALRHQDSLGNGSVIRAGDVQRMSAGTGIVHSEFNASSTEPAHLLQIWLLPERDGITPGYEEKHFAPADKQDRWCLVASHDGREGSLKIHQDVALYASCLAAGAHLSHTLQPGRSAYIQLARGTLTLNGEVLVAGDAAAIDTQQVIELVADEDAELLMFDLPAVVSASSH